MQKDHDDLVEKAKRIFCGSHVLFEETCETARVRCFDFLKATNKNPDPVERWKTACYVMMDVLTFGDEPYVSWANQVLDGYLADLLAKLHAAGRILDHPKPWPGTWPDKFKDNCPF